MTNLLVKMSWIGALSAGALAKQEFDLSNGEVITNLLNIQGSDCVDHWHIDDALNAHFGSTGRTNAFSKMILDALDMNGDRCLSIEEVKSASQGPRVASIMMSAFKKRSLESVTEEAEYDMMEYDMLEYDYAGEYEYEYEYESDYDDETSVDTDSETSPDTTEEEPTEEPTSTPTEDPTSEPTPAPTPEEPTSEPTTAPTEPEEPTSEPTTAPTEPVSTPTISGSIIVEGKCADMQIEMDDEECGENSEVLHQIGLAVIRAVSKATGIDLRFFKVLDVRCEANRMRARQLAERKVTAEYEVKIEAKDFDENHGSADAVEELIEEADLADRLKDEILKVDGISQDDVPADFDVTNSAVATQDYQATGNNNENGSSSEGVSAVVIGSVAAACVVGVVALVGFGFARSKSDAGDLASGTEAPAMSEKAVHGEGNDAVHML